MNVHPSFSLLSPEPTTPEPFAADAIYEFKIDTNADAVADIAYRVCFSAFAAVGHAMEPNLLADPVITAIAQRVHKTPAQVALAWAIQRGTAFLTTSTKPWRIQENFDISPLPEDAMQEIRDGITTHVRFNSVVKTGVPGFIPRVAAN
jgi:diketogulonate reductase-like aldo/keto reductase